MRHIVVDLEMHPIAKKYKEERRICRSETIEIGAVMLDEKNQEMDDYRRLIRPRYCPRITTKYQEMTGITTSMVMTEQPFEEVLADFARWCSAIDDDYEIIAWSGSDYAQIKHEINLKVMDENELGCTFLREWKDFQQEFGQILNKTKPLSLDEALTYGGILFTGHRHDAVWDARNTAELYRITRSETERDEIRKRVRAIFDSTPLTVSLADVFDFSLLEVGA